MKTRQGFRCRERLSPTKSMLTPLPEGGFKKVLPMRHATGAVSSTLGNGRVG